MISTILSADALSMAVVRGAVCWSLRTTVAVSQRSPAARKFVASESIGGYRADMAMSVHPLLP